MVGPEKIESGEQGGGSANVAVQGVASAVGGSCVSTRTRGKGKLACVNEELQALRKRLKVETTGSKDAPIEIPAPVEQDDAKVESADPTSAEQVDPMVESPDPTPAPTAHSPDTIRIRRALKALSLRKAERDFCEGSSSDRSEEISENMAELAEAGVLDMDYDSLLKRSVFASFQALHFSSAAARVRQGVESRESNLKAALSKATGDLDLETVAHAETLLELSRTRNELQMAKDALKSMDGEMTKLLNQIAIMENESKDAAVQYTLMARISMLLEPAEARTSWDVKEEIRAFKLKFPESSLEEWGVPEVEDSPAKSM